MQKLEGGGPDGADGFEIVVERDLQGVRVKIAGGTGYRDGA
jgi:hypothetical protein